MQKDSKNQKGNEANTLLATSFVKGDKVIWDSHSGYEIGYFIGEGNQYDTWLIDRRTGICTGECSHSKNEIHKYSDELIQKLTEKYKHEKRFSDVF